MSRVGTILHRSYSAVTTQRLTEQSIERYASFTIPSKWFMSGQHSTKPGRSALYQIKAVHRCLPFAGQAKVSIFPHSAHVLNRGCQTYSCTAYAREASNSSWLIKSTLGPRYNAFPACLSVTSLHRAYSSDPRAKPEALPDALTNISSTETSSVGTTDAGGNTWIDMLDHAHRFALDATTAAGKKVKELNDAVMPHLQQFYEAHPHLQKVIVPLGGTLFGTVLAWFVMPIILRRLHKYATESPLTALLGSTIKKESSYQTSLWSALEDPAKYLITFMAFSQMSAIIAPGISDYLPQAWRGAFVLSFVWFLHRWKTNFIASATANQVTLGIDRDRLSAFDKVSSLGLIALGVMALAEACGVAVQSILTVGGVGGVATAFAARDILGNMLSGFSLQFSKPFSVGDYIKAGSIEGQVVEIGLTSTSLINPEKFPVIVPNSLFSSQMIVNKSRAQWRASVTKVPIRIVDIEKIPAISEEIKAMLRSNPKVFLEKDAPYCYLSRLESSFGELTIGCNLKSMRKDEWFATEQDILLQVARVIRQHGAELGSTQQCC